MAGEIETRRNLDDLFDLDSTDCLYHIAINLGAIEDELEQTNNALFEIINLLKNSTKEGDNNG